jgi:alpha-amylase
MGTLSMKKYILIVLIITVSITIHAKKVKFAVDMTGQTVSSNGVHVTGDFQTAAGYSGGNWQSNTTTLTQEGTTNIYSVVVNIPAFKKYEYKFLNGDQFYDTEYVPTNSRVGYDFNDNRWIYVDSLANDTTSQGAILFSGNAPQGKKLLRVKVDLQNQSSVATAGVHVAGSFQEWNPAKTRLYSFDGTIYELIVFVTSGTYQYKYYNGNTLATSETVPATCATSSNRSIAVANDTALATVCFSACALCAATSISETELLESITMYPNPAANSALINFNDQSPSHNINIADIKGRILRSFQNYKETTLQIDREHLASGIYFIMIESTKNKKSLKLVFE